MYINKTLKANDMNPQSKITGLEYTRFKLKKQSCNPVNIKKKLKLG